MASSDDLFQTLPLRTQRAIDFAFNVTVNPSFVRRSARNESKAQAAPATGGGFIVDDVPMGGGFIPESVPSGGGGFLVDDEPMDQDPPGPVDNGADHDEPEPSHIRLAQIPAALQRLDLPPDDPEVLAVFKNAASGWTSSSVDSSRRHEEPDEQYVSREDFRSVCAVLLEHQPLDDGGDEDDDVGSDEYQEERASTPSSEAEEVAQGDANDSGSDEYTERRPVKRRRVSKGKGKQRAIDLNTTLKLTTRQRQVCLETYAMFFPDIPISDLPKQRLMIKHIQASFKLIGETPKTEELMDMVEMFSTSPDKSMSFDDFGKMMIVAKASLKSNAGPAQVCWIGCYMSRRNRGT